MSRIAASLVLIGLALTSAPPLAQEPLSFEVASIKLNTTFRSPTENRGVMRLQQVDGLSAQSVGLDQLVGYAYDDTSWRRVAGGPKWAETARFDIQAKASRRLTAREKQQMLRALLQDRFALKAHPEPREEPAFILVQIPSASKLGPNIRPSEPDCVAVQEERERYGSTSLTCRSPMATVPGNIRFYGNTMAGVAGILSTTLGQLVVDRTGIEGRFDFVMQASLTAFGVPGPSPNPSQGNDADVSFFTAVEEQLGLKLQAGGRGQRQWVVIDSAEMPSPD